MKPDKKSYEDRYKEFDGDILLNIKRQGYLDKDCEALENFNFAQSDEEKNNVNFSMTNPELLDLHLEDIDSLSNSPVVSKMIGNPILHNKQFYEICPQLNKSQQHLLHFKMQ